MSKWLSRYLDYVHISSVKAVPLEKVTGYAVYKRKQVKSSAARLARHDERKRALLVLKMPWHIMVSLYKQLIYPISIC